jgi:Zn-dependent protease with chaperone function
LAVTGFSASQIVPALNVLPSLDISLGWKLAAAGLAPSVLFVMGGRSLNMSHEIDNAPEMEHPALPELRRFVEKNMRHYGVEKNVLFVDYDRLPSHHSAFYSPDENAPYIFCADRGRDSPYMRIVLNKAFLGTATPREAKAVLAHEVGEALQVPMDSSFGLLRWASTGMALLSGNMLLPVAVYATQHLLHQAWTRAKEYRMDHVSAVLTQDPEAQISWLVKRQALARESKSWWARFRERHPRLIQLFHDHPPDRDRQQRLQGYAQPRRGFINYDVAS